MTSPDETRACCTKRELLTVNCCCGPSPQAAQEPADSPNVTWINGRVPFGDGHVPAIRTDLDWGDRCGSWKARWAVRRMNYRVPPGLYAVGTPTPDSPVLVSANYKLTFDCLRSELSGIDAWILVLDTKGVNVWCAAGKGSFGTDELARRIEQFNLRENTSHHTVIVPQLGAPGVAAHEVRKRTGVRVVYGPVRAEDIASFLAAGMKATPAMRRVHFPFRERVALIPVELVTLAKWPLFAAVLLFLVAGLGRDGYSWQRVMALGPPTAIMVLLTCFGSLALGPVLLPWLPGRAFSLKGLWVGLAFLIVFLSSNWFSAAVRQNSATTLGWAFLVPSVASVLVMAFTGASTYTSLSGVQREMKIAMPLQLSAAALGLVAWLAGRFV